LDDLCINAILTVSQVQKNANTGNNNGKENVEHDLGKKLPKISTAAILAQPAKPARGGRQAGLQQVY
jgi:hypothetical protein